MNETNRPREMRNTDSYEYRVSLIIPIYNMAKYLDTCFQSILNQSIDHRMVEVLMIDDGSKDNSLEIMQRYAEKYDNFKCYTKENGGPAQARNFGIKHATGKYIMYLDPDDYFGKYTIENVCNFFDKHYDEIDVVTYKIIPIKDGEEQTLHFRYEVLKSEGVYDLTELRYSFICHTNVNTCVKNKFKDNVLFSEEKNFRHEDQKYNIETLKEKQKIGYCDNAEYYYVRTNDSITSTMFYAYYIFESTMKFWEELFSEFPEKVPYYIQALYVSDINWKLRSDKLLPYHYSDEKFGRAWDRIIGILNRCDNKIIINHPNVEKEHRLYWLMKKKSNNFRVNFGKKNIDIFCNDEIVLSERRISLTLERCLVDKHTIKVSGNLQPLYSSIIEDVSLKIVDNLGESEIPVALKPSATSRFNTQEITNKFYYFEACIDTSVMNKFKFIVAASEGRYNVDMHFSNRVPFRRRHNDSLIRDGLECKYIFRGNMFAVHNWDSVESMKRKSILFRRSAQEDLGATIKQYRLSAKKRKNSKIWLYYDCKNVGKDNGFYQFEHDVQIDDDVQRFYVLNDDAFKEKKKTFPTAVQNRIVEFGSRKHVNLFLMADLIITAYAERVNYLPLEMKEFKKYSRMIDFPKVIYLQHGVLHAHTPWKYSFDRLKIDKEVISTQYEKDNLICKYGFEENNLIEAGMPRYDFIDANKEPRRKILYAPTWRNYLVERDGVDWNYNEERFVNSTFYKSMMHFVDDERLDKALEEHGYTLDIQLHPIFREYNNTVRPESKNVNLITDDVDTADYEIFITDFSSFVFDFVYLNRKILYFVPDYDLFKSGMNGYCKLDLPLEEAFGPLVQNTEEAVDKLIAMLNGQENPVYINKMKRFFKYKDSYQRDRVYKALQTM